MKVKFSNTDLERKSLNNSKKAISPAFEDESAINPFDLEQKVQTLKSKSEKLMVTGTMTNQSLMQLHH